MIQWMTWDQVMIELSGDTGDKEVQEARQLIQINKLIEFGRKIGKTPAELRAAGPAQISQWHREHEGRHVSVGVLTTLLREPEFK